MTLMLHPGEPLTTAVSRITLTAVDTALNDLTNPRADQDKAVHNARKTGKRVRAILRLVRPALSDELYRRENGRFRDASRLLAAARDAAVMVETLDALFLPQDADPESDPPPLPETHEYAPLRQRLLNRYTTTSNQIIHDATRRNQFLGMVRAGRVQVSQWPPLPDNFATVSSGLRRTYHSGRKLRKAAYTQATAHAFHEWRKQVKYLWHQLELLQPIAPTLLDPHIEALHTLSSLLGDDHDLAELSLLLDTEPQLLPDAAQRQPFQALLAQRQAELHESIRPLGQQLYDAKPSQFIQPLQTAWHDWRAAHPPSPSPWRQPLSLNMAVPLQSSGDVAHANRVTPEQVTWQIENGRLPAFSLNHTWLLLTQPNNHIATIPWHTTSEVAHLSNSTPRQIRRQIHQDKLQAIKFDRTWVVRIDD